MRPGSVTPGPLTTEMRLRAAADRPMMPCEEEGEPPPPPPTAAPPPSGSLLFALAARLARRAAACWNCWAETEETRLCAPLRRRCEAKEAEGPAKEAPPKPLFASDGSSPIRTEVTRKRIVVPSAPVAWPMAPLYSSNTGNEGTSTTDVDGNATAAPDAPNGSSGGAPGEAEGGAKLRWAGEELLAMCCCALG